MIPLGIIGSFATAFSYTYSADMNFNLKTFMIPSIIEIAVISALIGWIIVYPLFYWCLKEKRLYISLPFLYFFAILITGLLNFIGPRESIAGAFVYWIVVLLLAKKFLPERIVSNNHG
jgi:hypothetical protein